MSKRPTELTDPGPPPEDVLDATLRALGKPVRPPPRQTPESAGVDAAQYHADAHSPPKAHRPNGAADTMPMLRPTTEDSTTETVREPRARPARGSDLTTVPRGVPRGSKSATFIAALLLVLIVVGGATWLLMRAGGDEPHAVTPSVSQITPPSTGAIALSASEPHTAALAPSSVPTPPSTPSALTKPTGEPSATTAPTRAATTRPSVEARPTAGSSLSPHVAPTLSVEKPAPPPSVASPARPSASSRDDIPKDPL